MDISADIPTVAFKHFCLFVLVQLSYRISNAQSRDKVLIVTAVRLVKQCALLRQRAGFFPGSPQSSAPEANIEQILYQ